MNAIARHSIMSSLTTTTTITTTVTTITTIIMIMIMIFTTVTLKKSESVNVARNKKSRFCDFLDLSDKLTDGVISEDSSERTMVEQSGSCPGNSYVDVELVDNFRVHYVVVYQGRGTTRLDYFVVRLFVNGELVPCSEYPTPSADAGKRMIVNCQQQAPSNKVRIESRARNGMIISEIEVHTLDRGDGLIFRGCYRIFQGFQQSVTDLKSCRNVCSRSHGYAAMKNKRMCFCGDQPGSVAVPSIECFMKCLTLDRSCGGNELYSVYLVNVQLPHFIGCFEAKSVTKMTLNDANLSVPTCLRFCDEFPYASLTGGNKCACKSEESWIVGSRDYDQCNANCRGDGSCGGHLEASIYATCTSSTLKLRCSEAFRCSKGWDNHGMCVEGACDDEYFGSHCMERTQEGCPPKECSNLSNSECMLEGGKVKCICEIGYNQTTPSVCEDIDECMEYSNPCDARSTNCINLNGSFECLCKPGFIRLTFEMCRSNSSLDESKFSFRDINNYVFFLLAIGSVFLIAVTLSHYQPLESSPGLSSSQSSDFTKR